MTTVVLADDEALLRRALASLLPLEGDVTVIGEAHDGAGAVAATLRHRPDVLVIDLEMPGTDGFHAVAEIRRLLPNQVVLMLTRHARPGVLRRALALGVQGFASKSSEPRPTSPRSSRRCMTDGGGSTRMSPPRRSSTTTR